MVASLRARSFAEYLLVAGHDVTVITRDPPHSGLEMRDTDGGRLRILRVPDPSEGPRTKMDDALTRRRLEGGLKSYGMSGLRRAAKAVGKVFPPDRHIFWALAAERAVKRITRPPEIVLASAPPLSVLYLARRIAAYWGAPWIADYRDLISTNPYDDHSVPLRYARRIQENRLLRSATACTTVSKPLADELEDQHQKPAHVVMNGYEEKDFEGLTGQPAGEGLVVTYCGYLYPGKRDPAALLVAVRRLREQGTFVRLRFFGANTHVLAKDVMRNGLQSQVHLGEFLTHKASLDAQMESDVLLHLTLNDPRDAGVFSGKIFEYIAVGRPVLMLGYEDGVSAKLIRELGIGVVSNEPESIMAALSRWSTEKADRGSLSVDLSSEIQDMYTRRRQGELLEELLRRYSK
ncbi:glycosyltransferase [Nocardioides pakistanensis]